MRMHTPTRTLVVCLVVLAASGVGRAQSALRSTVLGTVRDGSGAVLVGAQLTLRGPGLPNGAISVATNATGEYRFADLVAGTFSLHAEAARFSPLQRAGIVVPLESTIVIDVTMAVAGPSDVVEVSAPTPMVDVTSSGSPTRLSRAVLTEVPTSRTLADLVNLAPGVALDVAYGGTQGSNDVRIEGVSLVEPALGNSWTSVSYSWLDQAQVVALGAAAEYNGSTGAITSAVLRSGSNRVNGQFDYHFTDDGWTSDNTGELRATWGTFVRPKTLDEWWDASGDAGGPVLRDRLWYFAGLQASRYAYRAYGFAGPGVTDEKRWRGLAKLDGAPGAQVHVSAMFQREDTDIDGYALGPGGYGPNIEASQTASIPNDLWNARASWQIRPTTLLEGRFGGYAGKSDYEPRPPATRDGPIPVRDVATSAFRNAAPIYLVTANRNAEASATLSHLFSRAGTHDVKLGLEFARDRSRKEVGAVSGQVLTVNGDLPIELQTWPGDVTTTENARTSVFLQDRWMTPWRLTFEPGLRIDANRGDVPVKGRVFSTTPIAPRFGVAWDVRVDHRTVVRAHVGRYNDRAFTYLISNLDVSHRSDRVFYAPGPGGTWVESYRYAEYFDVPVARRLDQSRVDQAVVGIEQQVLGDLSVKGQYIHRSFGDFLGYWNEALTLTTFPVTDPGPDGIRGNADDGGTLTGVRRTNTADAYVLGNTDGRRTYDAVQFVAVKRASKGWHVQGSYTWSRTNGTIGNQANTNAGYWDLSPGGNVNARMRPEGRPTFDFNEVKVFGAWRVSWLWGGVFSGIWRWQTGVRWARTVSSGSPYFVTVFTEAPGTRVGPAITSLDLRAEKTIPLGWRGARAGVRVDVFNATNAGAPLAYFQGSGPYFGRPTNYTDPRVVRAGLTVEF